MRSGSTQAGHLSFLTAHTAIGIAIFQVSTLIAAILIARELGPAGQGRFQLLIASCALVMTIASLGLDEALAYELPRTQLHDQGQSAALIKYALLFTLGVSLALGALTFVFSEPLAELFRETHFSSELRLAMLLLPGMMLLNMAGGILRGLGRADLRGLASNYLVGPAFLVGVAVLSLGSLDLWEVALLRGLLYVLAAALAVILIGRVLHSFWSRKTSPVSLKSLHHFGVSVLFLKFTEYVVHQPTVDLLIVGAVSGAGAAGTYFVASKIGSIIGVMVASVSIVAGPLLSESVIRGSSDLSRSYASASILTALIGSFIGFGVLALRHEMLVVFGSEYAKAELILVFFAFAHITAAVLGPNTPLLLAAGRVRVELYLTFIFSVLMLLLGIGLGQLVGPVGVAAASSGVFAALQIARLIVCRHRFKLPSLRLPLRVGIVSAAAWGGAEIVRTTQPDRSLTSSVLIGASYGLLFLVLNFSVVKKVLPSLRAIKPIPK